MPTQHSTTLLNPHDLKRVVRQTLIATLITLTPWSLLLFNPWQELGLSRVEILAGSLLSLIMSMLYGRSLLHEALVTRVVVIAHTAPHRVARVAVSDDSDPITCTITLHDTVPIVVATGRKAIELGYAFGANAEWQSGGARGPLTARPTDTSIHDTDPEPPTPKEITPCNSSSPIQN